MKFKHGFYDVFVKTCATYPSRIAVRIYDDERYSCYTYSELYGVCEYIAQNLQQLNCNRGLIGLVSKTNLIVPCVVAAAHKCCASFMFLDPTGNIEAAQEDMKFTIVISIVQDSHKVSHTLSKQPDVTINVFGMCICFYSFGNVHSKSGYKYSPELSFLAMSSGSTGEPKKIQVPVQCIQPNINDLSSIFHIVPEDIIYFSTPLTFDPSMVELLLAVMNGSSLLIAPEKVDILFPNNKLHSVTFWQTTPSKFFQFSNAHIKHKILSAKSTLKILALGGEPLNGIRRLKELKHYDNKTKIFTLYGVTEMSCWACVAELHLARISNDREVPLGKCLSETKVIVEPEPTVKRSLGKVILVSKTRKCYVLNKQISAGEEINSLKYVDTGDLAEVTSNGTIYYRGRRDDIVKRFGHKVNLQMIECTIMQCPKIKTCSAVWLPKPKLLLVYFSSELFSSQDLSDYLKCKLDDKHWPDRIVRVNNLPMSSHGKISKSLVAKIFGKTENKPVSINALKVKFLEALNCALNCNVTYEDIKDKGFFQIGGTSFTAIAMCNNIAYSHPDFGKFLLPLLMNQSKSIDQIIQLAEKEICVKEENEGKPAKRLKVNNRGQEQAPSTSEISFNKTAALATAKSSPASPTTDIQFVEMWTHNTGKCVDASPTLLLDGVNLYITVGSHSGQLVVIDAVTGFVVGEIQVGSRIEASVFCYAGDPAIPSRGIVGSYNGTIICFTIETCEELWRQGIGSMIKSKATCCNGYVYVAAYDGYIRSFDLVTGQQKDKIMIAMQAISADLLLAKNEYIMIGTLAGSCVGFHTTTGSVIWRAKVDSPVFSNPALYDEERYVVFAEVSGEIHCRTVEKGLKLWSFTGAKGNIFSSIFIRPICKLKYQMVFGCHDKCVYSIHVKNSQPSSHWKVPLSAPVYSTPCGINDNLILAASNDGKLSVISAEYGIVIAEYSLPNETFSSPAVHGEYIFIGCRNDLVYSLRCIWNLD